MRPFDVMVDMLEPRRGGSSSSCWIVFFLLLPLILLLLLLSLLLQFELELPILIFPHLARESSRFTDGLANVTGATVPSPGSGTNRARTSLCGLFQAS